MIKAICFDFDGTIVDSMPFLEQNAIEVLTKNVQTLSSEEAQIIYRKTTGLPFVQQIETICPGNKKNGFMVEEFERMKVEKIYDQKLFPETIKVLEKFKEKGFFLAISSGTIESIINEYLSRKGISPLVDVIMGWKDGFEKGKDHFEHLKKVSTLKAEEILFIGDSLNDAKRAQSNSIEFVGRKGMFSSDDFNKVIPKVTVIDNLEELYTYLNFK